MAALASAAGLALVAAQPAPPDFSGRWTAEPDPAAARPATPTPAPSPSPSASPTSLPRGDLGSGWGSVLTITQDARELAVEYAPFGRYDLQPPVRLVFALDGSETSNAVMLGYATQVRTSRAAWEGRTLRLTTAYPSVDPDGRPFTTEVTQRLSLDSESALVVEVARAGALGGRPTTARTVYRKN